MARTKQPRRPAPGKARSKGRGKIRVRMYRVGFGDFFLVTVPSAAGPKHILIDCGVHAEDIGSIAGSVGQMAEETDGKLALLIVSHRHADHISGFAKCRDIFARFTVERIWMSWFENPKNQAAMSLQAGIAAVANYLRQSLAARANPDDRPYINMVGNITGEPLMGATGQNELALQMLHNFPGKPPIDYYQAGDPAILPQSLIEAGLDAQILGPPIDAALVRKTDSKNQEYLAAADGGAGSSEPFSPAYVVDAGAYEDIFADVLAQAQVEGRVADVQPSSLAAKAAQANNQINNQSLVVLFGYNGRSLLFAGDAQWGNWANFMYDGAASGGTLSARSKAILGKIDFYKVGHHGSTNATPIDALAAMPDGCVAMCSTAIDAYPGVPRDALVAALDRKTNSRLARSDQIAAGGTARDDRAGKLPQGFAVTSTGNCGYVDYEF